MTTQQQIYGDDRPGMMRVHIADERSRLAGSRFTRDQLRTWAKAHGHKWGSLHKHDLGWQMAQHGLIDAAGNLRDGFPTGGGAS